jgi:hypothetical protein
LKYLRHFRRYARPFTVALVWAFCALFTYPAAIDPSSFATAAKFSVDRNAMSLSTGVATIEPRLGAPGYSWLRINFYSFPVAAEDIPNVENGNVQSMDKKWSKKASNPSDYNTSNAVIQLSVDSNFKVWQVDMAVPGHTCTIAPFEQDVRNFLQNYRFDGKRLKLRSKGTYVCDMKFMGIANQTFGWEIDLDIPVLEKRNPKQ